MTREGYNIPLGCDQGVPAQCVRSHSDILCVGIATPNMDLLPEVYPYSRTAMIDRVVAHLAACYSDLFVAEHTRASICILPSNLAQSLSCSTRILYRTKCPYGMLIDVTHAL